MSYGFLLSEGTLICEPLQIHIDCALHILITVCIDIKSNGGIFIEVFFMLLPFSFSFGYLLLDERDAIDPLPAQNNATNRNGFHFWQ